MPDIVQPVQAFKKAFQEEGIIKIISIESIKLSKI